MYDSEEAVELPLRSSEYRNKEDRLVLAYVAEKAEIWLEFDHRMGVYSSERKRTQVPGVKPEHLGSNPDRC